jgi:hypothetical protein
MNIKKALICLSIVAIVVFCTLNVTTASTSNCSTTIQNNARHTGDHIPMARGSTSNGTLNWNYATEGILHSSPATPNGIVYVGSWDHNGPPAHFSPFLNNLINVYQSQRFSPSSIRRR